MDNNDRGFGLTRGQYYKYSNDLKIESDWGFEVSPVAGTLSIDFSLSDKAQDTVREHFGVSSVPIGEERNIYLQASYAPENGDVTTLLYGSGLRESFEPDKDLANFIRYSIHEYADRELGTSPIKLLDESTTKYLRSEGYEHPEDTGIDTNADFKPSKRWELDAIRTWTFERSSTEDDITKSASVAVAALPYDYECHKLAVYDGDSERLLGYVFPVDAEDSEICENLLDRGRDPVSCEWEDGYGHLCSKDGWLVSQVEEGIVRENEYLDSDLEYPENVQDHIISCENPEEVHGIAGYLQMRAKADGEVRRQANKGDRPRSSSDER